MIYSKFGSYKLFTMFQQLLLFTHCLSLFLYFSVCFILPSDNSDITIVFMLIVCFFLCCCCCCCFPNQANRIEKKNHSSLSKILEMKLSGAVSADDGAMMRPLDQPRRIWTADDGCRRRTIPTVNRAETAVKDSRARTFDTLHAISAVNPGYLSSYLARECHFSAPGAAHSETPTR